jgi:DNA helicase MCM9
VFEPVVTEEAENLLRQYYTYLRQNPRVSKDRKSVRMLESLIRLSEAHARLLMKSEATLFDAVSIIILMEHTLFTCLFGAEPPPNVIFKDHHEYLQAKDAVLYRLALDPKDFENDWKRGEIKCKSRSPSPIKRLENNMFLQNTSNMDLDMTF